MYTDEVEIAESYALELFLLALDYEITHLANLAAQVLLDSLTVQNVAGVYEKLVGIHKSSSVLGELRRKIELWISFRFKSVAKTKVQSPCRSRPRVAHDSPRTRPVIIRHSKNSGRGTRRSRPSSSETRRPASLVRTSISFGWWLTAHVDFLLSTASVKSPMSPPESTTAAAAAPRSPQREGNGGNLRKSSGGSSGSNSGDLLSTTTTASSTPNGKRLPRFLNSSMPAVPTNRASFFTSPRAAAPVDEPDDVRDIPSLFHTLHSFNNG